jgi:rhamnosyltransferase
MRIDYPAPMAIAAPRVASVTVTYNPEPGRLARQLEALRAQVDDVIVVDNGSSADGHAPDLGAGVHAIDLGENAGVAKAFNVGMAEARRRGAAFVLLLDHDSIPAAGMVGCLRAAAEASLARRERLAAVGPRVVDARDAVDYPFIRLGWLRNRHLRCDGSSGAVSCDFLISSGCLIPIQALDAVGNFEEDLFVDSVDFEWCSRARHRGFMLYGVCDAELDHQLGDERRDIGGAGRLIVHSPERIYYMTRNRVRLYGRRYVPLKWKWKDVLRMIAKFAALVAFVPPRRAYARMTWLALRDAFAGRGGRRA